jgi:kynurenine formamidase
MGGASAGPHPSLAAWLRERGVAAFGSDGGNEVYPSVVLGVGAPFHHLLLNSMGMPLFDNLDLAQLAQAALTRSRWTFLFVAAPVPIRGASGSLVNPIAVF